MINPLKFNLRFFSFFIFPILIACVFILLNIPGSSQLIRHFFIWSLLIGITFNWIGWGIWGGVIAVVVTGITVIYAWMITGHGMYVLETVPALILVYLLYLRDEETKRTVTIKKLEIDEKEKSYNQLLQEYRKQETLREACYKKAKKFSRLGQIAKEIGFLLTPEEINRNIIFNLTKTIESGDVYILYGIGQDLQNLELQVLESPSGTSEQPSNDEFNNWVMRNRQPLIITDTSKDYRFNTAEIVEKTQTRSLIISPLITGDRLLGIIRIDSRKPETFTIDDLRLLAIISNAGALTLYNAQLYRQTEYLAIKDDLTGLYVKRYFNENLEKLILESQLKKNTFSLMLLDLDNFKDLNDQYGHSIGDKILQRTAKLIQDTAGPNGITARYGGEEFAILLPDALKKEAVSLAEKIRKIIQDETFIIRGENVKTTISIGVSESPLEGTDRDTLIEKADKRLYEAKRKGRNTVVG